MRSGPHLVTVHDSIQQPMFKQEFSGLKVVGQLFADARNCERSRESDACPRFSDNDMTERAETCGCSSEGRIS